MTVTALVDAVQRHLTEVHDDPSKGLEVKILENCNRQVTDPTPVTNLIQNLISTAEDYDFSRVLSIQPPVDFFAGLTSSLPPINLTILTLLDTAKYNVSDIGIVAGKPEIVGALVRLWLCTPDTAVATRAHEVILALLKSDVFQSSSKDRRAIADECLLWRRVFRDKDIYGSIFSLCSLSTAGQDGQLSKRDKTVAQARLLHMILCIDSEPLRTSQIPEIEDKYSVKEGCGLLHFAANNMVDYKDDVLMHTTLIDFYTKYLSTQHAELSGYVESAADVKGSSSYALRFLRESGIHKRTMSYYIKPESHDPLDLTYLYGSSASYLVIYCSTYPQDVLRNPEIVDSVIRRLSNVLQAVSPGQWSQGQVPKHDLLVMASFPRLALLPRNGDSPIFLLPPKSASPNAFNTLAYIFHGGQGIAMPEVRTSKEGSAARTLYFLYKERHPSFWTHIVTAAETVAIKDVALAAISLIGAIITAQWAPLPDTSSSEFSAFVLPSERALMEKCHTNGVQLPQSGVETIMSEPAIGIVVPYLMKPAQTFSNLVGGGRGDVESAAYKIAVAKHDVLVLLHQKLKDWVGTHSDAQEMVATVGRRVAQGPMGGASDVGGRVGTLDL